MTDPKSSSASSRPGAWEPPSPEALQAMLPQYEILSMLGRGGMGAVYKGMQQTLDRPVAIKILSTALEESEMGFAERFKNEARALGRLSHPGIVGVYDFGSAANGLLYIVMEFVDGTDVSKMLAKKGRLPVDHAMAITAHVCDALAYAHERGIIHRDIKPANIMVGYDGVVRVADFGLAKMSHDGQSGLTQSGMAMGTLHYMAPEALMLGSSVDHRADIYAVGVMLYQMLAGKLPQGLFEMPSKLVPGIDPRYDGIISKAMREDREARYQTILALRADLDHILTQPVIKVEAAAEHAPAALPTQARPQRTIPQRQPVPEPEFAPPPRRSSSNTLVWAAVIVLACVAGWLVMQRGRTPQTTGNTASAGQMAETPATATAANPPPTPSPNSTRPTTGVWINGLEAWWNGHGKNNDAFGRENDTQTRVKTDYALLHPLPGNAPQLKDQAVRARARLPDGKGLFTVLLRMSKTADGSKLKDGYTAELNGPGGQVRLGFRRDGKYTGIQNFTLASGFDFTQPHTLELQIISGILKVSLDGSILGTPTNAEITEGHPAVYGSAGTLIESFEFVNLDEALVPATAKPSTMASGGPQSTQRTASASTPKGESSSQWTIAFSKETHRSKAAVSAGLGASDLYHWVESDQTFGTLTWEFADARLGAQGQVIEAAVLRFKTPDIRHAVTTDELTVSEGAKIIGRRTGAGRDAWIEINLDPKEIPTRGQPFKLTLNCGKDAVLVYGQKSSFPAHLVITPAGTSSKLVKSSPAPSNPELLALEQQYRAALEKQVTPVVTEYAKTILASYRNALDRAARTPGVASTDAAAIRAETQRLATDPSVPDTDPPGTPQSLITLRQTYRQAVAAFRSEKEAPLKTIYDKQVAELRSKHASDPTWATKEHPYVNSLGMKFVPVPGTQLLMCIHETRNQDYAAFAADVSGGDEMWKKYKKDADIPVAHVNWDEAQSFCRWLSKKDGIYHRLPTDREWSIAVGVGDLEPSDTLPEQLAGKNLSVFPWGGSWPPPNDAGNYSQGAINKLLKERNLPASYADDYDARAPVMKFLPNKLGIHDLGGNVWEWCEDWYGAQQTRKVMRGSSYIGSKDSDLASTNRLHIAKEARGVISDIGFRCVVDLAASGATTSSAMVAAKQPLPTTATPVSTPPAPPPATPVPAPPAANPNTMYAWINKDGKSIGGSFVGLDAGKLTLRVDGKIFLVPLADLSNESQQQAHRLAAPASKPTASANAPAPSSPTALPETVPATGWQPVIEDVAAAIEKSQGIYRQAPWFTMVENAAYMRPGTPNLALRITIEKRKRDQPKLKLRWAGDARTERSGVELYWLETSSKTSLFLSTHLKSSAMHDISTPLEEGKSYELALLAVGARVAAFFEGRKVMELPLPTNPVPGTNLGVLSGFSGGIKIKNFEWVPLDDKGQVLPPSADTAGPTNASIAPAKVSETASKPGLDYFNARVEQVVMRASINSNVISQLHAFYEEAVKRELEICQAAPARRPEAVALEEEITRVRKQAFPTGSGSPTAPPSLRQLQDAYWKAAQEVDRKLDAKAK